MVTVKYITSLGQTFAGTVSIADNTTLGEFFENQVPADARECSCVLVNREVKAVGYVLQEGDRVTIAPRSAKGAVRVPTLRDFKRYLKARGWVDTKKHNGDHEIWKLTSGKQLQVNRDGMDHKMTDLASVKELAKHEKVSVKQLRDNIAKRLD